MRVREMVDGQLALGDGGWWWVGVSLTLRRCKGHAFLPLVEDEIPRGAVPEQNHQTDGEEAERALYSADGRWLLKSGWWRWQRRCW
jgi:hypothetical protein